MILANRSAGTFWSIEELFASIARAFPAWVQSSIATAPQGRARLLSLVASLRWANSQRDADIIHQTGDIRHVALPLHDQRFIKETKGAEASRVLVAAHCPQRRACSAPREALCLRRRAQSAKAA